MKSIVYPSLALAMLGVGSAAQAQDSRDWEFQITPYVWLSGLSGEVGAIPGLPAGSVDLSFGDILEDLEFAGMLTASARNGPWVIYLDTSYVRTVSTEKARGVIIDEVEVETETSAFALAFGRTIAEAPRGAVDAYIGARAWWLENKFDVRAVRGGQSKRTEKANWVDPLIGISGRFRATGRWSLFGAIEYGGFGIGAESEWSVLAGAAYQVTDSFAASFGWRRMDVDYREDGVVYDVSQSGPVLGATFRF